MNYDNNIKVKSRLNKQLKNSLIRAFKRISIGATIKLSELDEYDLEDFVNTLEEDGFDIIKADL